MEKELTVVHTGRTVGFARSQITLDENYNVPDYRMDVRSVIRARGNAAIEEVTPANGAVWIKGVMKFDVLYRCDGKDGAISCVSGEIPFREKLNIDGLTDSDEVIVTGEADELTVTVIHPRKINIRAIVSLSAEAYRAVDEEITSGVDDKCDAEIKTRDMSVLSLVCMRRETVRQREEIALPSSKPNVNEILWKSIDLRGVVGSANDDGAGVTGEIQVNVLYTDEESGRIQWYETVAPLECRIEGAGDHIPDGPVARVKAILRHAELDVKPDYDGEERILALELDIEIVAHVWSEQNVTVLNDIYSLDEMLIPTVRPVPLESLIVRNLADHRMTERMELAADRSKLLQICSCEGRVAVEKTEMTEAGIMASGILIAEVMYITTDDDMPVKTAREIYPFAKLIEIPDTAEETKFALDCGLGQMAAVMLDQEHIEIKAQIHLDVMAVRDIIISNIDSVEEKTYDEGETDEAGLIGYVVKPGDDLWDIAKNNHTTEADIMEMNNMADGSVVPSQKLLIMRKLKNHRD